MCAGKADKVLLEMVSLLKSRVWWGVTELDWGWRGKAR